MKPKRTLWYDYRDDEEAMEAETRLISHVKDSESFVDVHFQGSDALYRHPANPPSGFPEDVGWKRVSDKKIRGMDDPRLFIDGASSGDVVQGSIGNCWFVSCMSLLATKSRLLRRLFVSHALAGRGIYTCKFFKDGRWRYVHIDDQVAVNLRDEPMFARSVDRNETWVILLEKAYAKLHGCYENLVRGFIDYGLRDLTGGAPLRIKFRSNNQNTSTFEKIKTRMDHGSLVGCSFHPENEDEESNVEYGLLPGHAYAILRVFEGRVERDDDDDDDATETLRLLQLRNPWGMKEWSGDFCDNDPIWDDYPRVKSELIDRDGGFRQDGTFWMRWDDFTEHFNRLFVCIRHDARWHATRFEGEWSRTRAGSFPGGCPKFKRTFPLNPQHVFRVLSKPTRVAIVVFQRDIRWLDHQMTYSNGVGFVVISLLKNERRVQRYSPKRIVGMYVYRFIRCSALHTSNHDVPVFSHAHHHVSRTGPACSHPIDRYIKSWSTCSNLTGDTRSYRVCSNPTTSRVMESRFTQTNPSSSRERYAVRR